MSIFDDLFGWWFGYPPRRARNLKAKLNVIYIGGRLVTTATLTWTNPTTRTDGSILLPSQISSVDIFDDASGGGGTRIGNVSGGSTTVFATNQLSVGDHSFTVVVNDTSGHSSAPSNVATVTVSPVLASPSPVTNLMATLNP